MYYVGLDVHKKSIAYCLKQADGAIVREGSVAARRDALSAWAAALPRPWTGAMEATLFSDWIYDHLAPFAEALKMGHPARMRAIATSKKKTDRLDARTICDLLRCDLLPPAFVMPPSSGAYCATAICWCAPACGCRIKSPGCCWKWEWNTTRRACTANAISAS